MKTLKKLEQINDRNLEKDNILLLKCSEENVAELYVIGYVPRLVYFENAVSELFIGDFTKQDEVLSWILEELARLRPSRGTFPSDCCMDKVNHVGVIFVDGGHERGRVGAQAAATPR